MMQSTSLFSLLPGSDARMPEFAPFVAMAFLGTGLFLFGAVVGGAIALAFRQARLARWIGAGGLLVAVGYAALLLGASLTSRQKTLAPGERKYFCEIDCHVANSVVGVSTAKALGQPPRRVAADGTFSIVTLKTWFDPSTIASFRGNGPLTPNPRVAYLVDSAGRRQDPSPTGLRAWEDEHGPTNPLTKELRPGESYETSLVFDVPEGAPNLRLFVGDPPGVESVLIGHENSPLHGKIYFALPPRTS